MARPSQHHAQAALTDQTKILPLRKLLVVFAPLAASLFICYADQNGITIALPTIARALHAEDTISWAGTASLIANTVFQILYGRLSDIFGRKHVFCSALVLLALSDILVATAQSSTALYIFRGFAGIANGGINALTMMVVSDVVTLEDRGKYQGILGSCIGLGNVIGPFLSAAFTTRATWRGLFYFISPFALCCGVLAFYLLPDIVPSGNARQKAKLIDVWGLLACSIALIFLLIPISGGGAYFTWSSPMVISMLAISGCAFVAFLFIEWKVAKLPMMPIAMFANPAVATILIQNFLFGIVYYGDLYYLPIYYQNVRAFSLYASAGLIVPLMATQSVVSTLSGQYISHTKRYGEVLWAGFIFYTLGQGLMINFSPSTSPVAIVFTLITTGVGMGCIFQPCLVALQAHSPKSHRAVIISNRNFFRSLGGACGLAVSALILQSTLQKNLDPGLKSRLSGGGAYARPDVSGMSQADKDNVASAYMSASRAVFIFFAPLIGVCLLTTVFIQDKGLERPPEPEIKKEPETEVELGESDKESEDEKEVREKSDVRITVGGQELEDDEACAGGMSGATTLAPPSRRVSVDADAIEALPKSPDDSLEPDTGETNGEVVSSASSTLSGRTR
ncbi:MAG: hypothetical protein M1819_006182 [Sarea resinae]|nr:MAG: hypothetical protein M1819_006182 [Sarea resinae]